MDIQEYILRMRSMKYLYLLNNECVHIYQDLLKRSTLTKNVFISCRTKTLFSCRTSIFFLLWAQTHSCINYMKKLYPCTLIATSYGFDVYEIFVYS